MLFHETMNSLLTWPRTWRFFLIKTEDCRKVVRMSDRALEIEGQNLYKGRSSLNLS